MKVTREGNQINITLEHKDEEEVLYAAAAGVQDGERRIQQFIEDKPRDQIGENVTKEELQETAKNRIAALEKLEGVLNEDAEENFKE